MRIGFYPKLAVSGIKKNGRLYLPYILTCVGMVAMYFVMEFLLYSPVLKEIRGARTLNTIIGFGGWVMAVFAVIFLFYTNSFLIRRRKKEFGLYSILGMGKRNIGRILFWEALIVSSLSAAAGIVLGAAFSKLAEALIVRMLTGRFGTSAVIPPEAVRMTLIVFGVIFLLLFLSTLLKVHLSKPIELLKSENVGEKPPKANWVLGLFGLLLLAGAYFIAVSIEDPVQAMMLFFIAVLMVIAGSYMLFIAGSVTLCRTLQKNRSYYYRPSHFVSLSSMVYRMKRNGAGLASVCILATMVLVMLSSTACLFFGQEDSIRSRYPRDDMFTLRVDSPDFFSAEAVQGIRAEIEKTVEAEELDVRDAVGCRRIYVRLDIDGGNAEVVGLYEDEGSLAYILPAGEYNAAAGTDYTIGAGEAVSGGSGAAYDGDGMTLTLNGKSRGFAIIENKAPKTALDVSYAGYPTLMFAVPDDEFDALARELFEAQEESQERLLDAEWHYGFNSLSSPERQINACTDAVQRTLDLRNELPEETYSYGIHWQCLAADREDFYGTYGGLFFLGIMLSIVFIAATVLIIYYKQISEGYEDQARFGIMRKVGMTDRDIRRSIDSQLLTVFFLPPAAAGVHLAFAFPMIRRMLTMFDLTNTGMLILTTIVSFLIFSLLYTLIYRLTSRAYYKIVSGSNE